MLKIIMFHFFIAALSSSVPLPLLFLQWAMSQPSEFHDRPDGLWAGLFQQIGYSPNQMATLMEMCGRMSEQKARYEKVGVYFVLRETMFE